MKNISLLLGFVQYLEIVMECEALCCHLVFGRTHIQAGIISNC